MDCAELYTIPDYGLLVNRLNAHGGGAGAPYGQLPTHRWLHMAVTFQQTGVEPTTQLPTGLFTLYVEGQFKQHFNVSHSTSVYGAPVLAGEGDGNFGAPVVGSFVNFRMYNTALNDSQISALALSDYPQAPSSTSPSSFPTPSSSPAVSSSPTPSSSAFSSSSPFLVVRRQFFHYPLIVCQQQPSAQQQCPAEQLHTA